MPGRGSAWPPQPFLLFSPQLRLLLNRAASAIRPGRRPSSGINGQLQETSSRGHVARPLPAPWLGSPGRRSHRRSRRRAPGTRPEPSAAAASGGAEPPPLGSTALAPNPETPGLLRGHWGRARPRLRAQPASKLCGSRSGARSPERPCPRQPRGGGGGCWASRRGLSSAPGRRASCRHEDGDRRLCPPPRPGRRSREDARRAQRAAPAPGTRRPLGRPAIADLPGRRSNGRPSASAAAAARRARRPPLPGLGVQRAAPACAEPELRGQREPGTSAAEAETRRGGPSATPWPRLESSLRAGRGGGGGGSGPEPGPGASPAEIQSDCAVAGAQRLWDPPGGSSANLLPRRERCARAPPLSAQPFLPASLAPLSQRPHRTPRVSYSREPPAPFRTWSDWWGGGGWEKGVGQPIDSSFCFPSQALQGLEMLRAEGETSGGLGPAEA
nr:collagen alpha-1(I) chain-like [Pongo pygmaeus]